MNIVGGGSSWVSLRVGSLASCLYSLSLVHQGPAHFKAVSPVSKLSEPEKANHECPSEQRVKNAGLPGLWGPGLTLGAAG